MEVQPRRTARAEMSGLAFFDTNVLLYADDIASPEKRERTIALFAKHLRRGTAVISLQVLQEYFAAATRKLGVAPEIAQRKVELLARGRVVRLDAGDVVAGGRTAPAYTDFVLGRFDRSRGAVGGCGGTLHRGSAPWRRPGRGAGSQSVSGITPLGLFLLDLEQSGHNVEACPVKAVGEGYVAVPRRP
jgi:predicted nucleic acid-binding protein